LTESLTKKGLIGQNHDIKQSYTLAPNDLDLSEYIKGLDMIDNCQILGFQLSQ
jgi:hypothetical protein